MGEGYEGLNCTDRDECLQLPCGANAICENALGSFACACKPGYRESAAVCGDIDECREDPGICYDATCHNTEGISA